MTQNYAQAHAHMSALLQGDPCTIVSDYRGIHDTDKAVPAVPMRGTLDQLWGQIVQLNNSGFGIFANMNALDGLGRKLANVTSIRVHAIDLDNLSSEQNFTRACAAYPAPAWAVKSSVVYDDAGNVARTKYHVYWSVVPYVGNDRATIVQKKLRQTFDSDATITDASRVLRLPGTLHLKDPTRPHLVTCEALAGYGVPTTVEALEQALAGVNVIEHSGGRSPLGDPELSAPSLDWVKHALQLLDPNNMSRSEWISTTAAIKQAAWLHSDPDTIYQIWSEWCARYESNDIGENIKQWNDLTDTQVGWNTIVNRVPSLKASLLLDHKDKSSQVVAPGPDMVPTPSSIPPMPEPPPLDCSGEYLTDVEQRQWFAGCTYIVNLGEMLTSNNRFLNTSQFNAAYGGKYFLIDGNGKKTNEAWAAATRSTLWMVPKVDHIRFIPSKPYGEVITDDMGRKGVNTYKPVHILATPGDAGPFLRHIAAMLPDPGDQKILLDYLAHNVRFPGFKIPWAPVIQSVEGAGKGVMKLILGHCIGRTYVYFPNAKQLGDSGSQFNAWMRNKLFILADEIKVDDKRDMIEVLKPMISEETIEIQGKGQDQDIEDNFSNWLFFTNWRDAVPVDKNSRRFSIMYSVLQTAGDLISRGMDDAYFKALYDWLKGVGAPIVAHYLLNYPIERGSIPMRAPDTSSTQEAVRLSRGPIERAIAEAVEDAAPGFRFGWVSATMVARRLKDTGVRAASAQMIETILQSMGYAPRGRAPRLYMREDQFTRPYLFSLDRTASLEEYGRLQGWE